MSGDEPGDAPGVGAPLGVTGVPQAESDLWWKNAIFYCLDIETYLDTTGDGTGDVNGLMRALDHPIAIGVDCLWLMPFFETPNRDDGYDVSNHYAIDDRLGNLGEFSEMLELAQSRGLRVMIDLVVNHTSTEHPWFRSAREGPDARYHDYYVWSDEPRPDAFDQLVFPEMEEGFWAKDDRSGRYYLHRFFSSQPDLNVANPDVRQEISEIVAFWSRMGVDGFRVDAVPFLLETEGTERPLGFDSHLFLRDLRRQVSRRNGSAVLLGEVNRPPQVQRRYFGEVGDELQLVFGFHTNQAMWLSLARQDAGALAKALADLPVVPDPCAWVHFVRLHDELNLDQLTEAEREEIFEAFAPSEEMRIFGRGIRRRLASMLEGDKDRIEMVTSLSFSLPGAVLLYAGDEIGMGGENLDEPGRAVVRLPMQWSAERHGGFSPPSTDRLVRDMPTGRWGPEHVNVHDQYDDPASLLSAVRRLVRHRRQSPEIACGSWRVLDTDDARVLAILYEWGERVLLVVHNLHHQPAEARITTGVGDRRIAVREGACTVEGSCDEMSVGLDRFGHAWIRLVHPDERLLW